MKNKTKSFRENILVSNILMISIICLCILLFNLVNTYSINQYSETVDSLQVLSSFYQHIEDMTNDVKNYLVTSNVTNKNNYDSSYQNAEKDVQTLIHNMSDNNKWRFELLENMLFNFNDISNELMIVFNESSNEYKSIYDEFLRTSTLISQTNGEYYELITVSVNEKLSALKLTGHFLIITSIALIGSLLIWLIYYSNQLTNSITKPIDTLLQNMQKVKTGQYDLSVISGAGLEMEGLCHALNDMALSVQNNIETVKENNRLEKQVLEWKNELLKKDEQLAQSELKMLQNQINPHFLFNTLNMIYKMSIQEGANKAADILIKTSQLLRYGLDKQNKISDINSEVDAIKKYIEIQEVRLGNRVKFDLVYENSDEIGHIQIPGMILQPLVENSLKHGLKDYLEDGVIEIRINGNENSVLICVSDNGNGMSTKDLEEMILSDYLVDDGSHLGLYNVVRRLEAYFQKDVSISFNSDVDCGFEVMIEIICES